MKTKKERRHMRIGVVGHSSDNIDEKLGTDLLDQMISKIAAINTDSADM